MQSSTAIAFRALVMLILLICVPLLAIFGSDLPAVVRKFVEGKLALRLEEAPANETPTKPAPEAAQAPTANPFAEAAPYRSGGVVDGGAAAGTSAPAGNSAGPVQTGVAPNQLTPPPQSPTHGVAPAGGMSVAPDPNWQRPPEQSAPAPAALVAPPESRPIPPPSQPAHQSPPPSNADHLRAGANEPAPVEYSEPSGATSGDDRIRRAEQRLRVLGATQYKLETWGPQNKRYRFSCRMAVNGNAAVSRHFELVEDDPWLAMEGVLKQVEQWHAEASR